jgi:NADPH-dependent ferric siderophore reductase
MNLPEPQKVRRIRPKPRLAEVVRVERLTPHMVRVVFAGEELEGFTTRGPAEHLKVNFPPPGEAKLALPEWGPEGPILLEGQQRPLNRTYTPRRWDRETGELAVDFLLHGEGPGSTWAQQARPGQLVAVSHQPGGAYKVDNEANWYLIGGDEAALPAVGTLLEALPASCFAHVFVEVADGAEELPLESSARFQVTWLHHGRAAGRVGRKLEEAVREFPFPAGDGRVWIGCEAGVMRDIRRHLLNERGMDRAHAHTQGYWKYGATNHPDNDRGQDVQ